MVMLVESIPASSDRDTVQRAWRYLGGLLSTPAVVPSDVDCCVALLVDVDDFVVRAQSRGANWATKQIRTIDGLLRAESGQCLPTTIHHVDPDEWIVIVGGTGGRQLSELAAATAESIRASVASGTEVTVTVGFGSATPPEAVDRSLADALVAHDRKLVLGGNLVIDGTQAFGSEGSVLEVESIEQPLAQRIRQGDRDGAVLLLRDWIAKAATLEGVTSEMIRRWVAAQVLSAMNTAGERRTAAGPAMWAEVLERASLQEFVTLGTIHERSFLNLWVERMIERVVHVPNDGNPILTLVTSYLEEHFAEDLGLVGVARAVGCSPYYVSHLFQREMGTTFLTHLTGLRIARARYLLTATERTVDQIAGDVGYGTARHFRTVFKRTVGVTPTSYRRSTPAVPLEEAG